MKHNNINAETIFIDENKKIYLSEVENIRHFSNNNDCYLDYPWTSPCNFLIKGFSTP